MKVARTQSWFINPWADSFLIICFPSIIITLIIGYAIRGSFPGSVTNIVVPFITLLGLAHILATVFIIYLDWNGLRARLLHYLWIPLLLASIYFVLTQRGFKDYVASILFYWAVLHVILQGYFITQVYNLIQGQYHKIDAVINSAALIVGPVYSAISCLRHANFYYGGWVGSISVNQHVLTLIKFLSLFSLAAFIVRQAYLYFKQKKLLYLM